jgi:hypothetical protein
MSKVALAAISVMSLSVIYLGIVATICVLRDQSLARASSVARILVSWFVPILGPILTIRIAAEESPHGLRSRWWLWPLRSVLSDETPDPGYGQVTDMRADAERILPGSTFIPPP